MAENKINKLRKKLKKTIKKFNESQCKYVAVGKHVDNTDIVMIIDSYGADSLRHILTIRHSNIYAEKDGFTISPTLLEFVVKVQETLREINELEKKGEKVSLTHPDIPKIKNPFDINDSITKSAPIKCEL